MPKLSFMKWYPADWLQDTGLLSAEARGVWIDILCRAWNASERGVYHRLKEDFCRELRLPIERYESILLELAKVGDVMIGNDSVTIKSRRMVKLDKAYKLNSERVARYRSNANVTRSVMAKTLDVRRSQDVRLLKTTTGEDLPTFVLKWQTATPEQRQNGAAQIAQDLKAFKLSFRVEEEMYNKIMGEDHNAGNGTVRSKSISEQVAQRRRKEEIERLRNLATSPTQNAKQVLDRIRDLPKVSPETGTTS